MRRWILRGWLALLVVAPVPCARAAGGPTDAAGVSEVKRLYDAHEYAACLATIARGGAGDVTNPQVMYYSAGCKLALGQYSEARQEYTRVLGQWPGDAYSYLGRALAAAHMGCAERVKRDFDAAASLDPKGTEQYRAATAKEVEACLARVPKESTADLLAALKKAESADEPIEQLAVRAERLIRASNAARFVKEEAFGDRLRELTAAVKAQPKDAERLAALGEFLVSPSVMRTVTYDGRQGRTRVALSGSDPAAADRAVTAALQIDPKNVRALTQKMLICQAANDPDGGIEWARRALLVDDNGDAARFYLDYYSLVAGKLMAQANGLRSIKTRDEFRADGHYTVTVYPSPADLAQAEAVDAQADDMRRKAAVPLEQLIKEKGETPEGLMLQAEFAQWRGHYDEALDRAEAAIKLDFFDQDAHDFIVELAPKVFRMELAHEHDTVLQNFVNPWAGRALEDVWTLFPQRKWDECLAALATAERLNPADASVPAFRVAVAAQRNVPAEVATEARLAILMEEGRARSNGKSLMRAEGPLDAEDVALAMSVRCVVAAYDASQKDPAGAAGMYQANAQLAARVPRAAWAMTVQRGAIPSIDPAANANLPSVGGLLSQGNVRVDGKAPRNRAPGG